LQQAIFSDTSKNTKPKVSGLISHTNTDGTLGGLLSVVHYQRSHVMERAATAGWLHGSRGKNGIAVPRSINYDVFREERTRSGVNAAFDWRPNDAIKLGVDAMYSKYEIDRDGNAVWLFTALPDLFEITADENNTATWFKRGNPNAPGDSLSAGQTLFSEVGDLRERDSTNKQLGANLSWKIGEQTALEFDGSWSKADNNPDPRKGYFMNVNQGNLGDHLEWNLNPGGFPGYSNLPPLTDASNLRTNYLRRRGRLTSDQLVEFKTHLTRSFYDGVLSRLQFGASGSTRTKDNRTIRTTDALNNAHAGAVVQMPEEFVEIFNAGNVAGAGGPTQWLTYDPIKFYDWLATEAATGQVTDPVIRQRILDALAAHGGGINPIEWPQDGWKVREKNVAAFARADFEGDWGTMPWKLNVGVRYIRTELTSNAVSSQVESITQSSDSNSPAVVRFTEPLPLSRRSTYHDWLPSLNFRLNLRDDLVLRASASETLTRPTLTSLRASETLSYARRRMAYTAAAMPSLNLIPPKTWISGLSGISTIPVISRWPVFTRTSATLLP